MLGDEFLDLDTVLGDIDADADEGETTSVSTTYKKRVFVRAQLLNLVIVSLAYTCAVHFSTASKASFRSTNSGKHNDDNDDDDLVDNNTDASAMPSVDALWFYATLMTFVSLIICAVVSEYFGRRQARVYDKRLRKWHTRYDEDIKRERSASASFLPQLAMAQSLAGLRSEMGQFDDVSGDKLHSAQLTAVHKTTASTQAIGTDYAYVDAMTQSACVSSVPRLPDAMADHCKVQAEQRRECESQMTDAFAMEKSVVEKTDITPIGNETVVVITDITDGTLDIESSGGGIGHTNAGNSTDTAVEIELMQINKDSECKNAQSDEKCDGAENEDGLMQSTTATARESATAHVIAKKDAMRKAALRRLSISARALSATASLVRKSAKWSEKYQVSRVLHESADELSAKFWHFVAASMAFSVAYAWKDAVYTLIITLHKRTAARLVSVLFYALCICSVAMLATAFMHYKTGIATRALLRNLKQTRKHMVRMQQPAAAGRMLDQTDRGLFYRHFESTNASNASSSASTHSHCHCGELAQMGSLTPVTPSMSLTRTCTPVSELTVTAVRLSASNLARTVPSTELPLNSVTLAKSQAFFKNEQLIRRSIPFVESTLSIMAAWAVRDSVLLLIDLVVGKNRKARLWSLWVYAMSVFVIGYLVSPSMALKMRRHKLEASALRKRQTALEYSISVKVSQEKAQLFAAAVAEKKKETKRRRQSLSVALSRHSLPSHLTPRICPLHRHINYAWALKLPQPKRRKSLCATTAATIALKRSAPQPLLRRAYGSTGDLKALARRQMAQETEAGGNCTDAGDLMAEASKEDSSSDTGAGITDAEEESEEGNASESECVRVSDSSIESESESESISSMETHRREVSVAKSEVGGGTFVSLRAERSTADSIAAERRSSVPCIRRSHSRSKSELRHAADWRMRAGPKRRLKRLSILVSPCGSPVMAAGRSQTPTGTRFARAASADTVTIDAVALTRNYEVSKIYDENDSFIDERKREKREVKKQLSGIVVKARMWELFMASVAFNCGLAFFDAGHSTLKCALKGTVGNLLALLMFAILMTVVAVICTLYLDVLLLKAMRCMHFLRRNEEMSAEIQQMSAVGTGDFVQRAKVYWAKLDMLRFFGHYLNAVMSLVTALSYALSFEQLFLTVFSSRKHPTEDAPMLWLLTFIILSTSVLVTFVAARIG